MKYLEFFIHMTHKNLKDFGKGILHILPALIIILIYLGVPILSFIFEIAEEEAFNLNPNDYCNITDVEYIATLKDDPDGKAKIEITEYLTFDVHAASASNKFKELWRELPEDYVDGVKVTYDVFSVTQIMPDGQEIPYKQTNKMYWEDYDYTPLSTYYWHHSDGSGYYPDNDESVLIYIPWTYRDKLKFKIVYQMNNAALKYNDCSELYISMYSGKTINKLNSFKATILVPNQIMPKEGNYSVSTYGTNNSKIPFVHSSTIYPGYNSFSIDLNKAQLNFRPYNEYIEFCLLSFNEDKHIFTKYAPNNTYTFENCLDDCIKENKHYENLSSKYRVYKVIGLFGCIFIAYFVKNYSKKKLSKVNEQYTIYKPEVDYNYFRDIPSDMDPLFASKLAFIKNPLIDNDSNNEEYAAILLSLARKKYITIANNSADRNNWENKNIYITLHKYAREYAGIDTTPISDLSVNTTSTYVDNDPTPGFNNRNQNILDVVEVENDFNLNSVGEKPFDGEELEPLSPCEKIYLKTLCRLCGTSDKISLSAFETNLSARPSIANDFLKQIETQPIKEIGINEDYFQVLEFEKFKKELSAYSGLLFGLGIVVLMCNLITMFTPFDLLYGGLFFLGFALIGISTYVKYHSYEKILLTQKGADEQAKWQGLYNFLNSDTLMNEREVIELPLWEQYLVYATAFGISEKVIKAIQIRCANVDMERSPILNSHSFSTSRSYHSSLRSFGRSMYSHSSSYHSSFAGRMGGHGGYGGGGRGGGGGGGGH